MLLFAVISLQIRCTSIAHADFRFASLRNHGFLLTLLTCRHRKLRKHPYLLDFGYFAIFQRTTMGALAYLHRSFSYFAIYCTLTTLLFSSAQLWVCWNTYSIEATLCSQALLFIRWGFAATCYLLHLKRTHYSKSLSESPFEVTSI